MMASGAASRRGRGGRSPRYLRPESSSSEVIVPVIRRYLTGLSAAGVTAAVVLAGAIGDASASPAVSPPNRVVTLTSSSSSPTGNITLKVKYHLERGGRNKVLSATFSGGSKVGLKNPALIVSLRPVVPLGLRRVGRRRTVHVIAFTLILRLHSARHFSGSLPARVLRQISKVFAGQAIHRRLRPAGFVLSATAASVSQRRKPIGIAAPVGLQVGVLLGPVLP